MREHRAMPISRHARAMRTAISPRLATISFSIAQFRVTIHGASFFSRNACIPPAPLPNAARGDRLDRVRNRIDELVRRDVRDQLLALAHGLGAGRLELRDVS
jgi:hypothetical protein